MDELGSFALLAAFLSAALFLVAVPGGKPLPSEQTPTADALPETAQPVIAPPPDWRP